MGMLSIYPYVKNIDIFSCPSHDDRYFHGRHAGGKGNVAFADGHVEGFIPAQVQNGLAYTGKVRWTYSPMVTP